MKEIALVYMVAGLSSRFGGKIKQFAKVGPDGETLIEYSLNQALKSGFSKIIFIVGSKTEQPFKEMFGDNYKGVPILYALQKFDEEKRDKPWGTADAVCCAKNIINCPFIVCNGDDIYGENTFKILFEHLQESDEEATIGYKLIKVLPETGTTHRGIFQTNEQNYVRKLTETFNIEKSNLPATNTKPDDLCSMNIYALHPQTLELLNEMSKEFKEKNKSNRKIEFLLPNEISKLIEQGKIKMKIYSAIDKWLGITNHEDEEIVKKLLKKNKIPIEISNRHIHLSRKDLDFLFGKDYKLEILRELSQLGEFAAKETVSLINNLNKEIKNVRILGPERDKTQIELLKSDTINLKINPPVRLSGNLENTPGIKIIGPKGSIEIPQGVILAQKHLHISEEEAEKFGIKNNQIINIRIPEVESVLDNIVTRVKKSYKLALHIDKDEAEEHNISKNSFGILHEE